MHEDMHEENSSKRKPQHVRSVPAAALLITTPHMPAVSDVDRSADQLSTYDVPIIGYIANMTHAVCDNCGARMELYPPKAWAPLDVDRISELPADPALSPAIEPDHPLTELDPCGPVATALFDMVDTGAARLWPGEGTDRRLPCGSLLW